MCTSHADSHMFLRAQITGWGIPRHPHNHVGESHVMIDISSFDVTGSLLKSQILSNLWKRACILAVRLTYDLYCTWGPALSRYRLHHWLS
jgi:hypothetical protein